jgi:hypothetical protein
MIMKKTIRKINLLAIAAMFLLHIAVSSAIAQGTVAKPGDNCDKIIMKSGKTLTVDITRIDTSKIYYVKCDSMEPQYTVLKSLVESVKYATDNTVYSNDETYGKVNTNSFGWNNYSLLYNSETANKSEDQAKDKNKTTLYDRSLRLPHLKSLYQSCPAAMSQYKLSKTFDIAGLSLMTAGCAYFLLSNNQVTKQQVDDHNTWWNDSLNHTGAFDNHKYFLKKQTNGIIGLGVAAVGAVLVAIGTSHYINSISIYNEKHSSACNFPVQYNLTLSSNGVGISMRF